MIAYKLTDENDQTCGSCQWGEGKEHTASGEGELCGPGWLHVYSSPLLAVLLNPIHGKFDPETMHLWECEVGGKEKHDRGLKSGYARVKTIKRIDLPEVTTEQRVRFGILCAMEVCKDAKWRKWAERWLSGEDRTEDAARDAWDCAWDAVWPPEASTRAAAWAVWGAAWAAWGVAWGTRGAAWPAEAAAWGTEDAPLDLQSIAERALQ